VGDRSRAYKHIPLISPSHIFNEELSARVGEQRQSAIFRAQECNGFWGLQNKYNFAILISQLANFLAVNAKHLLKKIVVSVMVLSRLGTVLCTVGKKPPIVKINCESAVHSMCLLCLAQVGRLCLHSLWALLVVSF
jgi:hypothetical protein